MTRHDAVRSTILSIAAGVLGVACSTQAPASPTPPATAQPTPIVQPTGTPGHPSIPRPTLAPPEAGTATIETTGDVATTITLPWDSEMGEFPSGDGEFDLRFQDEDLNTLNVTLELTGGQLTDSFVGLGVPGTALEDEDYYADFFRLLCDVEVTRLDATAVEGTYDCPGLENGAGTRSIDARGAFSAIP